MSNILSPDIEKSIIKQLRQQSAKSKKLKLLPDKKGLIETMAAALLLALVVFLVAYNMRLLEQFN